MERVEVGGVNFHVVRMGPGPGDGQGDGHGETTIVFLHGLIIDNISTFYYTVAPVVARRHDVVCYDMRGHGFSDRPRSGYRVDDAVDDLFGILDAVGVHGPVLLCGYSYGSTVALSAAATHPERVTGLVLIECRPACVGWADDMLENLEDAVAGFDDPGVRDGLATMTRGMRRTVQTCEDLVTRCTLPADFHGSTPLTEADLAAVACPTLLVYGEHSDDLDSAFLLDDLLPHTELHIVDSCSHHVMVQMPETVTAHIAHWLETRR